MPLKQELVLRGLRTIQSIEKTTNLDLSSVYSLFMKQLKAECELSSKKGSEKLGFIADDSDRSITLNLLSYLS
ncbi:hypothetical protein D4Z78_08775 [Okeania hirsuta]|nr:hypothetical protein D4Z78_08775 [Okeania hirsuta]